jgi:hypothetical protein
MSISDYMRTRYTTIDGERISYRYNIRTRQVTVPSKGIEFTATCWDAGPTEVREHLAAQNQPQVPAQACAEPTVDVQPAPVMLPNVFRTSTLTHYLGVLADGTPAPKCRKRPTKGTAEYSERGGVSCNSCTGAHLPSTRLA